jgi:Raf kinase inhibitor-like YbhB/YbcL family protein
MILESPAFARGGKIPTHFTCFGENRSPPLRIREVPPAARSLTLMLDQQRTSRDVCTLWVLFNIDPNVHTLDEGEEAPGGARRAANHWGQIGYHGPHHEGEHAYTFRLFALDCRLELPDGVECAHVFEAMGGHVLAKAELPGIYDPPQAAAAPTLSTSQPATKQTSENGPP